MAEAAKKEFITNLKQLMHVYNNIKEVSSCEEFIEEDEKMIQGFGAVLIVCGFVHLADFVYIISHPKIAWLRK